MRFQQGLSGFNVVARNLDVIGNNIANVSTVGFKQSRVEFADVCANWLYGSGGSAVAAVPQSLVPVSSVRMQGGKVNLELAGIGQRTLDQVRQVIN